MSSSASRRRARSRPPPWPGAAVRRPSARAAAGRRRTAPRGRAQRFVVGQDLRVVAGQLPGVEERRPVDVARAAPRAACRGTSARPGTSAAAASAAVQSSLQAVRARLRRASGARAGSSRSACWRRSSAYASRVVPRTRRAPCRRAAPGRRPPRATHPATWTTGPEYAGSSLTAVWARDVVAPPISSGSVMPSRSISCATVRISSSEGVIRPDRPMKSAFSARAVSRILRPRHHHAQIDDPVAVAGEHDADDVLADVVDVALDRGHDDRARVALVALGRGRCRSRPPSSASLAFSASMNGIR